jgi:hypothetical protein
MTVKLQSLFCGTFVCCLAFVTTQCTIRSVSTGSASSEIPHLRKQGTATQLIVDGKPFLALAGELLNSNATSIEYLKPVWPELVAAKLNTVLAGVSWNQIEPQEGKFDFSVLDGVIQGARSYNLRLVLLWFGTWKNGLSSYPPDWVKRDFERFPRAQIVGDKTPWPVIGGPRTQIVGSRSIELLSPFSDARAFAALMRHVKEVDGQQHTVIMIQVENEIGMQGDTRDRSPVANQAYAGPVPKELMDYLEKHKGTLIPELRRVWEAAGLKPSGTWEEVFGQGRAPDEIFMAWNFARYVGRVVEAGKAEYPIPMYVNCPHYGFGTEPAPLHGRPPEGLDEFGAVRGQSGCPMPDAMDVWRAGAPRIDILSPDIAPSDFVPFCAKYTQSGNPLFIPETQGGRKSTAARALYAFGRHDAIGFSPFGIDAWAGNDPDLPGMYDLLSRLAPLILEHQGKGTMSAVLLGPNDPPQKLQLGNYTLEAAYLGPLFRTLPPDVPTSAAIFIATGPDEYFVAGSGVSVLFSPNTPGPPLAGLGTVEEGTFVNGRWVPGRQLAGDDTGQGDFVASWGDWKSGGWSGDTTGHGQNMYMRDLSIQRVTLYRYR